MFEVHRVLCREDGICDVRLNVSLAASGFGCCVEQETNVNDNGIPPCEDRAKGERVAITLSKNYDMMHEIWERSRDVVYQGAFWSYNSSA